MEKKYFTKKLFYKRRLITNMFYKLIGSIRFIDLRLILLNFNFLENKCVI